jgi:transaldolase
MTKFFLDSCNPNDTKLAVELLGKLDGQTTNPSLLVKNPNLQNELKNGKISSNRLLELYKQAITEIANQIPQGSVSIEVYADKNSTAKDMLKQAEEFYTWIPNAHIKFPATVAGLEASTEFVGSGGRVNMTLVFSQEQALAVHLATQKAKNKGDVFVSPFVGRLDDIGQNGIDLVSNILKMYKTLDSKVEVLGASLRSNHHLLACISQNCDIVTAPFSTYQEYKDSKKLNPKGQTSFRYKTDLGPIKYKSFDQNGKLNVKNLNIQHDLTDKGLDKFASDWNGVLL